MHGPAAVEALARRAWTVVFPTRAAAGALPPWAPLLGDWPHVFAIRPSLAGGTLLLNHEGRHLLAEHLAVSVAELAEEYRGKGMRLLSVASPVVPRGALLRGPMTCVEAVKAALGIRAPFVVTPRQLAQHLIARHGARFT